jgi:polysaccharide export outer membrane protein
MSWIGKVQDAIRTMRRRPRIRGIVASLTLGAIAAVTWGMRTVCCFPEQEADTKAIQSSTGLGHCVDGKSLASTASQTLEWHRDGIALCQAVAPAQPEPVTGRPAMPIYAGPPGFGPCDGCPECAQLGAYGPYPPCVPWQPGDWGEYVAHPRLAHVPVYRLRVDDQIRCVYRVTRNETTKPYELNVGDEVQVESFTDPNLNRSVIIQPDGSITLRLLGQVKAGHLTVVKLNETLEKDYTKFYKQPAITVTPIRVNTKLLDLIATVDARAGTGGEGINVTVTPDGTISLPAIGPVPVQGMTLDDLKREIDARYSADIEGVEVTPILVLRAPRFVYVLGEVHLPGRFVLEGPTTMLQALSMAGSWNVGANIKQIVVFRRSDDWRLMATMVNLHRALGGKNPCPAGEIWLGDSDVVLVPKSEILKTDDFINLVFTRGIYGVMPFSTSVSFNRFATVR